MLKNTIIATLVTLIYHSYIVEGTPVGKKIFAIGCVFMFVLAVMEEIDSLMRAARYQKVFVMSNKAFENYKRWIKEDVLQKKAKEKEEIHRENLVMNIILRQKKYAFSGKQISELLNLAKIEGEEREVSGQVCS